MSRRISPRRISASEPGAPTRDSLTPILQVMAEFHALKSGYQRRAWRLVAVVLKTQQRAR